MARHIDADAITPDVVQSYTANADVYLVIRKILDDAPTADVVETDEIAKMLFEQLDFCPCDVNGNDEWLPLYCDHNNTCDCDYMECWRQFVKYYKEREGDKDGKM